MMKTNEEYLIQENIIMDSVDLEVGIFVKNKLDNIGSTKAHSRILADDGKILKQLESLRMIIFLLEIDLMKDSEKIK